LAEQQKLKALRRWQAYSQTLRRDSGLVAYYTFEAADCGNTRTVPNRSTAGGALDGQVEGADWVSGRLPGKYALYFHGPGSGDKVVLPQQERFNFPGSFSVAAWFRMARYTSECHTLIAKGDTSWRLLQYNSDGKGRLLFGTDNVVAAPVGQHKAEHVTWGKANVADGHWHLVVATYEPAGDRACKRLYVDGRLDGESNGAPLCRHNSEAVWLGADSGWPQHEFQEMVDEVAIFSRALPAAEITAIFNAGNPTSPAAKKTGTNK
jgi:hypothetical protein